MAILFQGVHAMMGEQKDYQHKVFITGFNLEKRVPKDHILRKIQEQIDFDFIYKEVKHTYGVKGNVSVPPPVILKLMLLLILYNLRSERELMSTLSLRLDWLWFLGYDIEDEIPKDSVLSKARARWGVNAFKKFFERILWQCVEAGLVDGNKPFIDSSLIDADASNDSVIDTQSLKKTHIPSVEESHRGSGRRKGIFSKKEFTYNPDTDTFTCPAGKLLKKQKFDKKRRYYEYKAASKACMECHIRDKCTRSKFGRTLKRYARQDDLDAIIKKTKTRAAKRDLKTRQHLSERSFAQSSRYGYKRARWRTLWRMEIQDYLIAVIQNIKVLINQPKDRMSKSNVEECRKTGFQCLNWLRNRVHDWAVSFSMRFLSPNFSKS
jgi:transposase